MKPYISIEIKVRYVDLNKIFNKEKVIQHHRFVDSVDHSQIVIEKILCVLKSEGVAFYKNDEDLK